MRIGIRIGGERVKFRGERYQVSGSVSIDDAPRPVPVLLGALGPQMLRLAGRLTAGTVTWLAGMHTLENHIVPRTDFTDCVTVSTSGKKNSVGLEY